MKNYIEDTTNLLKNALESVEVEQIESLVQDCIDTLERGNKIIASGLGKNVPVCDKFVGTMNSLGLNACFMNTNSATHGDIGMVQDGDLVIILTKSGETTESIYLHNLLNKRQCKQWLLTFEEESTLGNAIEKKVIIHLEHEGDMWNIVPNNSTTLNLIVLQTVTMNIAKRMNITLEAFKRNHPGGHIGEILNNE